MKGGIAVLGLLVSYSVFFLIVTEAKKSNKKASAPQWKSSSMPHKNIMIQTELEGNDLKMNCKAQGHPKPNVKWLKDGRNIRKSNLDNMIAKKFGLTLEKLTPDMSGNYTCRVKNKHGSLEWTFIVDVQAKVWPLLVEGPRNLTQMVGSSAAFRCRILNDPTGTIRWQRVYKQKDSRPKVSFIPDPADPEVLKLENIQVEDGGEYRCMTGNIMHLKYSSAWLTVIEPVLILPTDLSLTPGDEDNDMIWPDPYYTTTKRPRRNKGRGKNGRKNKDNKFKNSKKFDMTTMPTTFLSTRQTDSTFSTDSFDWFFNEHSTTSKVWTFQDGVDEEEEGYPDTRYNPQEVDKTESIGSSLGEEEEERSGGGDISAWKIYTIVGAVGGVVLLMGLVAITIALCCPKEEGGTYKATPV